MGEVRIGDRLIGADGRPVTVVAATEVMHGRPCYEVEFSDGEVILADAQHQWLTWTRAARRYDAQVRGLQRNYTDPVPPQVVTTEQIAATLHCETLDHRPNHAVQLASALELPEADLPIPPYALGVWAGDGHTAGARFTTADPEIAAAVEASGLTVVKQRGRLNYGMALPTALKTVAERVCVVCGASFRPKNDRVRTCGRVCGGKARFSTPPVPAPRCSRCGQPRVGQLPSVGLCNQCWREHGSVQAELRTLGLLGNKHIPVQYLRASITQRHELLAGLLDTDGTVTSSGSVQLAVTNRRLAEDVRELVLSLGYRCSMTTKRVRGRSEDSSTCYMVNFTTTDQVFRLPRKEQVHQERSRHRPQRTRWRYIVDVRPVPSVPVRCVQVDSADHLYLAGRGMIPTHNSTLALDLARAATIKHSLPTVIFSLEMSRNEITMRLLSAEARVPLHSMRTGQMGEEDWTRLARRMSEVVDAPLFIDDSPNMSMMEIRAKCRRLKQRQELKLVIVDYLQLMSSPKRTENRQQEVSEMSRSLKLLAKEIDVPVIAISQLNRGPEQRTDKRPLLSDLRESGSIEQDSDVVILLHREDVYEKKSPPGRRSGPHCGEAQEWTNRYCDGGIPGPLLPLCGHGAWINGASGWSGRVALNLAAMMTRRSLAAMSAVDGLVLVSSAWWPWLPRLPGGSGGAAADQPDGRGDEQDRQREQPAALDPLEWPEPAARLVADPVRVAVLGEIAHRVEDRLGRVRPDPRRWGRVVALEDVPDRGLADQLAVLGVPVIDDPRGTRQVGAAGDQRCDVVLAQPQPRWRRRARRRRPGWRRSRGRPGG